MIIWNVICYRGLKFPQWFFYRVKMFWCVVRKLRMLSICFLWHCDHKCCLSGCATEMLVVAAYMGHLSGLDTNSVRHSCIQCDLTVWKLIDNELARCWIGRARTFSGLWGHMTLPTRKIFCGCIWCSCSAFPSLQDEVKDMQDSISKTTLPVNISVLRSTWQQCECSVDICHVNGNTEGEYL